MRQCYWCGEVYAGVHVCPDNEGDEAMTAILQRIESVLHKEGAALAAERLRLLGNAQKQYVIVKFKRGFTVPWLDDLIANLYNDQEADKMRSAYDCPTCQDTFLVPTDDPLSPDGKARCPDCAPDDTLRDNQRA